MQFTIEQKKQLRKQAHCLFMDLEDIPLDCESWGCLKKPQVWSVLETKRVYGKRTRPYPPFSECATIMVAIDSGFGLFAIFENDKLLHIEKDSRFVRQIKVLERDVLILYKSNQNTTKCIWI